MTEDKPGFFTSEIDAHPGTIQFPYPLMLEHFREWWKLAVEGAKGTSVLDYAFYQGEWDAAKKLLIEYGEWRIDGLSMNDVLGDRVPQEVVNWVVGCADLYVTDFLPPKARRRLSALS